MAGPSGSFLTLVEALIRRKADGHLATHAKPLPGFPGPVLAAIPSHLAHVVKPHAFGCSAQEACS
jgi:hypothetical protein